MKKSILLGSLVILGSLSACQGDQESGTSSSTSVGINQSTSQSQVTQEFFSLADEYGKSLIVYFSEPEASGVDAVAGASRVVNDGEVLGNTEQTAAWIAQDTGMERVQIEPATDYPSDHDELVNQADEEQAADDRPEISFITENLNDYDTIFIGYPIWWADLPMPVYSFFDNEDFSGKTLVPFSTHGGSGFANTIATIEALEPDATVVTDGLTISRNDDSDSRADVQQWLANFSSYSE
ncbi:flavodoxin [Enterococcus faecalis]|nr:flavodoxin [Enterococcus faecalis]TQA64416.1 flavodoxin [Enterococcus faecalis]